MQGPDTVQRVLTVLAALALLVSGAALTQSDGWLNRLTPDPEASHQDSLLPWQHGQEHWLVVVVDFDDATTQSTGLGVAQATTLIDGEITDYLSLMAGGEQSTSRFIQRSFVRRRVNVLWKGQQFGTGFRRGEFLPSRLVSECYSHEERCCGLAFA